MTVQATLVDHETGETLAETELDPADLPPSFQRAEATLEVGGLPWRVLHAEPDGRDAIARAGTVKLSLVRAEAAVVHEEATRDDSLPPVDEVRGDHGLSLPPSSWRQIELIAAPLRSAIDEEMEAIREIAKLGRRGAFPRCHVRERVPNPLGAVALGRAEVMRSIGAEETRPLAFRGMSGVVRGGFALPMGESILYGTVATVEGAGAGHVNVLAIGGHAAELAPKVYELANAKGLLLVDWCLQKVWEPGASSFVEA